MTSYVESLAKFHRFMLTELQVTIGARFCSRTSVYALQRADAGIGAVFVKLIDNLRMVRIAAFISHHALAVCVRARPAH